MSQDLPRMIASDKLTKAIQEATSPEQVRALLEEAMEGNHLAARDPQTGRFAPAEPSQQTQQTSAPAATEKQPTIITKVETIAGQQMEFTGTELDVANQISAAYRAANAVKQSMIQKKSEEQRIWDAAEAERLLKTGQITTAQYLERTNAVETYLAAKGFDVNAAASSQYEKSWAQATEEFLHSAEGADWPGGDSNREILGMKLIALGLEDAADKVSAIKQAYAAMKDGNLVIETEPSPEEIKRLTDGLSPRELLELWKQSQQGADGTAQAANEEFIRIHGGTGGYSGSGIFGK